MAFLLRSCYMLFVVYLFLFIFKIVAAESDVQKIKCHRCTPEFEGACNDNVDNLPSHNTYSSKILDAIDEIPFSNQNITGYLCYRVVLKLKTSVNNTVGVYRGGPIRQNDESFCKSLETKLSQAEIRDCKVCFDASYCNFDLANLSFYNNDYKKGESTTTTTTTSKDGSTCKKSSFALVVFVTLILGAYI